MSGVLRGLIKAYIKWRLDGVMYLGPPVRPYNPFQKPPKLSLRLIYYKIKYWQWKAECWLDKRIGYNMERVREQLKREQKEAFRKMVELIELENRAKCGHLSKKELLHELLNMD